MILGSITIGQSPRSDMIPEMKKYLGPSIEVVEAGALDKSSLEDIEKMKPDEDDYVLVSKLRDGSSVKFGERHILPKLQEAINDLEEKGADLIFFACTGVFPDIFESSVPIVYPDKIIRGLIPNILDGQRLGVLTPDINQEKQSYEKWSEIVEDPKVGVGSPYGDREELIRGARSLKGHADIILLDCMGYTEEMKDIVKEETGALVICSKTLVARVLAEMLD